MNWNNLELPDNPYYQDDAVLIYHADCREILPQLPKVDLVLTDPPYGNGTDYPTFVDSKENLGKLIKETMPLILQVSQRVLITCGVGNLWLYPPPSWVLSWTIPAGIGSGPWGFCCWQPILAYGKDPYLSSGAGRRPDTLVKYEKASSNLHPCAKPIDVWKWLVVRGSVNSGETILDPFLGSGTTVEACKAVNRKCIGIEIEEKYCEIAAKRCCQTVMNFDTLKERRR